MGRSYVEFTTSVPVPRERMMPPRFVFVSPGQLDPAAPGSAHRSSALSNSCGLAITYSTQRAHIKIIQDLNGRLRPDRDWRMEVTDEFANRLYVHPYEWKEFAVGRSLSFWSARRFLRSPDSISVGRSDAADHRRCALERYLHGRWQADESDPEELTCSGLSHLWRLRPRGQLVPRLCDRAGRPHYQSG